MTTQITAELRMWEKKSYSHGKWSGTLYLGDIYGDSKQRWTDGQFIYTSDVMSEEDMDDHIIVHTRNSVYKLMKDQSLAEQMKHIGKATYEE